LQLDDGTTIAVGNPNELARGESLKISIAQISYTLATGKHGDGYFTAYTGIHLQHADKLKINRSVQKEPLIDHSIQIDYPQIVIQPASSSDAAASISGVSFKVDVGPDAQPGNVPASKLRFLTFLSPALLLFLRKA
jgi:hypothetical protein